MTDITIRPTNAENITAILNQRGWRPATSHSPDTEVWYKRFPDVVPRCKTNDSKPGVQVVLHVHRYHLENKLHVRVEIDLTAETRDGVWVKYMVYGLTPEEALDDLDKHTGRLIRSWRAAND